MDIYTAAITLFLVMDPLGNIPIFLSALSAVEPKRRSRVILREALIAFVIMVLFLFAGKPILNGLHITQAALSIAGGIILFLIAIKMIFPSEETYEKPRVLNTEPFIVPLAIPLIAGPSALAVVMLLANDNPSERGQVLIALVLASIASTVILLFSNQLRRVLGQKGLIAMERLMGMILTILAVQMLLSGLDQYFNVPR
jgi:multiple antibiotic resistance protein